MFLFRLVKAMAHSQKFSVTKLLVIVGAFQMKESRFQGHQQKTANQTAEVLIHLCIVNSSASQLGQVLSQYKGRQLIILFWAVSILK